MKFSFRESATRDNYRWNTDLTVRLLSSLAALSDRLIVQLVLAAATFVAIFGVVWISLPGGRREALDALRTTLGPRKPTSE